jgi:hypothetical protein
MTEELFLGGGVSDGLRALSQVLRRGRINTVDLDPAMDWVAICDVARAHGVTSLLYWKVEEGGVLQAGPRIPAEVRAGLERDFYVAAARAMVTEWRLVSVLKALQAASVPALVIKGAAIAALYPDPALRPYGDLDILVRRTQLNEAVGALERQGYHCTYSPAWSLEYGYDVPMASDDGRSVVELHWRLDYSAGMGRLPVEDLWGRAVPYLVNGQPGLQLEPVDTVLHLCAHAAIKHRVHLGLRPLCDLTQITHEWESVRWKTLTRRASDYGLARPVSLMLTLAEKVLGLVVPEEVMSTLLPAGNTPLPSNLAALLLDRPLRSQMVDVPAAMVQAGAEATLTGKLHRLLWHLFLPRHGMAVIYRIPADSPRIWLTYLRRPVDLLRRYGGTVRAILRGQQAARVAWEREAWLERWLRADDQRDDG